MKKIFQNFKLLIKNEGFIKYFKNTSWLLGEKLFRIAISIFVAAWVARYLGPQQFGLLNYVISLVGLFTVISSFGLDNIVIKELVKNKEQQSLLLGTSFCLRVIGSLLVLGLLAIVVNFSSNNQLTNTLIFVLGASTIFQSFSVVDFYFQSEVLSKYVVYANIASFLVSSIIKIILILAQAPLILFALVILFDSFTLSLGLIYYYQKISSLKLWKFDKTVALRLLNDSWPLIISGFVIAVYMKIDQIMIKEMLGDESVGQYAAAVKLSEVWYFIPVAIASSLFPSIINTKTNNKKLYSTRLQNLYDLMVYLSIGIAIPTVLASDWIVNLLYGSEYNLASSVLKVHVWAGVFVFLGVASSKWLLNENLQRYSMINTFIGALVNIGLNYLLIKKMGVIGAAWSSLIAYFIAAYLCLFLFKKTRPNFYSLTKSLFLKRLFYDKKID